MDFSPNVDMNRRLSPPLVANSKNFIYNSIEQHATFINHDSYSHSGNDDGALPIGVGAVLTGAEDSSRSASVYTTNHHNSIYFGVETA